jgi:hypothetical protein
MFPESPVNLQFCILRKNSTHMFRNMEKILLGQSVM